MSKTAAYWTEQAALARAYANSRPAHDLKGFFNAHRDAVEFDRAAASLSHAKATP
jgi:hypothetical protein